MTSKFLKGIAPTLSRTWRLQTLSENPQPIPAQDFFDLLIVETPLDHFSSDVLRVRMISQLRNEVWFCHFRGQVLLPGLRPPTVDELEEIEADPNAIDPDQIRDVLDVVHVMVERVFFFSRTHKNGVNTDHSATFTDHLDLFVTNVAFDVIVPADVRVRNNERFGGNRQNVLEPCWIDVRKINHHTERFALLHDLPAKRG